MSQIATVPACESTPVAQLTRLRLFGARVTLDAQTALPADVLIEGDRIADVQFQPRDREFDAAEKNSATLDLSGFLLLPGLVNAHDHLEFSLFPRLGRGPYPTAARWAKDIYRPEVTPLREHLAVPKPVRLWWGGIKNLLSGVTTVCHHNPYQAAVFGRDFPVRVLERYAWAHSLHFGGDPVPSHRTSAEEIPFLIHAAEGTDAASADEIFELNRGGMLNSRTVIIHGVGLNAIGRKLMERQGASLVWCPTSNVFTLGKTLSRKELLQHMRVALASDSPLTAEGDLLDEIRAANQLTGLDANILFRMLTTDAAALLRLSDGEGTLERGARADLLAVTDTGESPAQRILALRSTDVELVLVGGRVRLLSPRLAGSWLESLVSPLEEIRIAGSSRFVSAPVRWLIEQTRAHLGHNIHLAHRLVES